MMALLHMTVVVTDRKPKGQSWSSSLCYRRTKRHSRRRISGDSSKEEDNRDTSGPAAQKRIMPKRAACAQIWSFCCKIVAHE